MPSTWLFVAIGAVVLSAVFTGWWAHTHPVQVPQHLVRYIE